MRHTDADKKARHACQVLASSHMTDVKKCNANQHNVKVSITQNASLPMLAPVTSQALTTEKVGLPAECGQPDRNLNMKHNQIYENMIC